MKPELREHALKLARIARDVNQPIKTRLAAAKEVNRLRALAAKSKAAPRTTTQEPVPVWWIASHTALLQSAAVREDQPTIAALVAEFVANGVPVPDYPGKPRPEPEVPEPAAAHMPVFNEAEMALRAKRIRPAGKSVMTWDEYQETF